MRRVVVTGSGGSLGRRLVAALADDPAVEEIVAIDVREEDDSPAPEKIVFVRGDVADIDLKPVLEGATAVVHLAWTGSLRRSGAMTRNVEAARRLFDAAGATGVPQVVHLSSATVYGAWPDNPVPLSEDAPLRPNAGFTHAVEKAEIERVVAEWRDAHPSACVAVLRPGLVLAPRGERDNWLALALGGAHSVRVRQATPPVQVVHPDDVVGAILVALRKSLDGAFNVVPDGWIAADTAKELVGGPPRVGVPEGVARRVAAVTWRLGLTDRPPAALPYLTHPWVVANDRLRAEGWSAQHTNEEALVIARPGSAWRELSPKRRQEVTLGIAGTGIVGAVVAAVAFLRRRARERRTT